MLVEMSKEIGRLQFWSPTVSSECVSIYQVRSGQVWSVVETVKIKESWKTYQDETGEGAGGGDGYKPALVADNQAPSRGPGH